MTAWIDLLLAAAIIGGVDVAYFHLFRLKLATRAASRRETLAHSVQGASFAAVCGGAALGSPPSLVLGAFALHFAATVADILLEGPSRLDFGGLARSEVVLHIAGAVATIGAVVAFGFGASPPTALQKSGLGAAALSAGSVTGLELAVVFMSGRATRSDRAIGVGGDI
jgi:hypothetical protein